MLEYCPHTIRLLSKVNGRFKLYLLKILNLVFINNETDQFDQKILKKKTKYVKNKYVKKSVCLCHKANPPLLPP